MNPRMYLIVSEETGVGELNEAIVMLKMGSLQTDGIKPKTLKYMKEEVEPVLRIILNRTWNEKKEWQIAILAALHKKDKKMACEEETDNELENIELRDVQNIK